MHHTAAPTTPTLRARRLPRLALPVLVLAGLSAQGAACSPAQCAQAQAAVTASAKAINAVLGAISAWEMLGSDGPQSCNDPSGGSPDLMTASFEGSGVRICTVGGNCTTTPDVCEPAPMDTTCNACVRSACCAEAPAFAGEVVAACIVACQSGLESCGGRDVATASAFCGGAPDAAYTAMGKCVQDHCASPCSALTWTLPPS